eukprot:Rmarinus@m.5698
MKAATHLMQDELQDSQCSYDTELDALFVADPNLAVIWIISIKEISIYAGHPNNRMWKDGTLKMCRFSAPVAICTDSIQGLFVVDRLHVTEELCVRSIAYDGYVSSSLPSFMDSSPIATFSSLGSGAFLVATQRAIYTGSGSGTRKLLEVEESRFILTGCPIGEFAFVYVCGRFPLEAITVCLRSGTTLQSVAIPITSDLRVSVPRC